MSTRRLLALQALGCALVNGAAFITPVAGRASVGTSVLLTTTAVAASSSPSDPSDQNRSAGSAGPFGVVGKIFGEVADRRKTQEEAEKRRDQTKERVQALLDENQSFVSQMSNVREKTPDLNVLGGRLEVCGTDPMTGFTREGCCTTGPMDVGSHTVCSVLTDEFLQYSRSRGNDLITPRPEYRFPGLKAGDRWCLCASRWQEAFETGSAPPVVLRATHTRALSVCKLEDLMKHAVDAPTSQDASGGSVSAEA